MPQFSTSKVVSAQATKLSQILISFLGVFLLRIFFDAFAYVYTNNQLLSWQHSVHALAYFSSIFLSFVILLLLITKESIEEILSFLAKLCLVILAVPLLDLALNQGKIEAFYVTLGSKDLFSEILNLLSPLSQFGLTKGIYFSAYVTLLLFFIFIYQKTHNLKKGFAGIFFGYLIFVLYATGPSGLLLFGKSLTAGNEANLTYLLLLKQSWLGHDLSLVGSDLINLSQNLNNFYELIMARLFWLGALLQSAYLLFLLKRPLWRSFLANLRLERIFNYILIATIGIVISDKLFGKLNLLNSLNLITLVCFFSLIALNAWLAALVNDQADLAIDEISNPNRPLIKKEVAVQEWLDLHKYLFMFALFGLFIFEKEVSFLLVLTQVIFYLYSTKPILLKRNFLFSSLAVGFSTVAIALSGFFLVSPQQQLSAFPVKALFLIGLSYACLSNLKDIKDYTGDKANNIKTMPVFFGLKKSKLIIAILYAVVFFGIPIFLNLSKMLPVSLLASLVSFYFFLKPKYQEKYIFFVKFVYMFSLYCLL